jgi:hypothetical protein
MLCELRPYKTTQVQVTEEVITREIHISATAFCGQYMTVFKTQKLHSSLKFPDFIWVGLSVLKQYILDQY